MGLAHSVCGIGVHRPVSGWVLAVGGDVKVLSIFDNTGNMVKPWADAGYDCYCVDTQHAKGETKRDGITYVGADARDYLPPAGKYAAAFFFPPCTDVAVSGARWFRDKGLGAVIRALELFKRSVDIAELMGCPYLIENPVSTVSKYWRAPDHIFDPCDYGFYLSPPGDAYTKRTCLWTGAGLVMPEPKPVDPVEGSKMHRLPPSADRANLRSATPMGFANAVYQANAPKKSIAATLKRSGFDAPPESDIESYTGSVGCI